MYKAIFLVFYLLHYSLLQAQVPFEDIIEDKQQMADSYYGTFKYNGKPYSGNAIAYHENGKIKTLRGFKDGLYHGLWTEWYDNGNRKFRGDRRENKGDGLTRWWYENGQLRKQGTYDLDKQQGVVVWWHPNGNLKQIRYYEQDKPVDSWTTFEESGDVYNEGNEENVFYRPFFNEAEPPKGYEQTSPSFTSDGETIVFAQYVDWVKKVPYIAHYQNDQWEKEQLTFMDTLYNLAISPNGERIVFEKFEFVGEEEITRVYIVDKTENGWSEPKEVTKFYNLNAGYFQFMEDGTLLFFARKPKTGIYFATLDKENIYSHPKWLKENVNLDNSDSFDVLMHPNQDKLIITQAYSEKKYPERGKIGFYYYEKVNGVWERIRRLPLGYGWGASITPDGKFVFVRNGKIQYVPLRDINVEW